MHLPPDKPFEAMCGATVTPKQSDIIDLGGHWFDPTCVECHQILTHTNPAGAA
jgi:hypothetical protein